MDVDRIVAQLDEEKTRPSSGARGIRNNNPGNIRKSATQWQGQTGDDGTFCIFSDAKYGLRALAKVLLTYHDKYGLCTVRTIINRWAPPSENDTASYIAAVCADTAFGPDDWLHVGERSILAALVRAIVRQENGVQPYDDTEIAVGVDMALA